MSNIKATGWDTGLCQDYNKGLARWLSSRLDARHIVRKYHQSQEKDVASNTRRIAKTRKDLVNLFSSYLSCARGIDDIKEEGDINDLEDAIDVMLEALLKEEK